MRARPRPWTLAKLRDSHPYFVPTTDDERVAVRHQLERILASPVFRNSRRYAGVLRYVVERTLDGAHGQLKERTIGIEVFGRTPDYDTAIDHVVRSAAAEVRKRLAQYYQDGASQELRIELQSGSYIPLFRLAENGEPSNPSYSLESALRSWVTALGKPAIRNPGSRWIGALALVAAAMVAVWQLVKGPGDPLDSFWAPVLSTREPVLLCVGNIAGGHHSLTDPLNPDRVTTLKDFHGLDSQLVHVDDAVTLARITGLLQARGKSYAVKSQSQATYVDLQSGPAVLVGLMNNNWTERLVLNHRFTVEHPKPELLLIRDRENPSKNDWYVDYSTPYLNVTKDYALVLRESDPKTDRLVVTVAGLSVFGTLAAGELVTDAHEMRKLEAAAPKGWRQKNMEIVLSTDVIRGEPGHATVVASRFW